MKCDRRWWNDGRLEREKASCVADDEIGDPPRLPFFDAEFQARLFVRPVYLLRLRLPESS